MLCETRTLTLAPGETATLQFRVDVRSPGKLCVSALRVAIEGQVHALFRLPSKPGLVDPTKGAAPGHGMTIEILGGMPLPEARIVGLPEVITASEVCRSWLVVRCAGAVPMTAISVAVSSRDVSLSNVAWVRRAAGRRDPQDERAAGCSTHLEESSPGVYVLDPSTVLHPGDEVWCACVVSPPSRCRWSTLVSVCCVGASADPGGGMRTVRLVVERVAQQGPSVTCTAHVMSGSTSGVGICLQVRDAICAPWIARRTPVGRQGPSCPRQAVFFRAALVSGYRGLS